MTPRMPAVSRQPVPALTGGARRPRRGALLATCGVTLLVLFALPAPAAAQWGKLEKLSGPGGFHGPVVQFRVACFGDVPPPAALAESLTREAIALTLTARNFQSATTEKALEDTSKERESVILQAETKWEVAADAWARALGETRTPTTLKTLSDMRERVARLDSLQKDNVVPKQIRHRARSMATSSSGVAWAACSPLKERRFGIDVAWSHLSADGRAEYTGSSINVDMLMTSVSVRVFARTDWDVLDVSAGAGAYWFTSAPAENASAAPNPDGIPGLNGVVVQPILFTVHAPSSWISREAPTKGTKFWTVMGRIATIPSLSWGYTLFPAGFAPGDFGAGDGAARRFPSEWLKTLYVSANIQPILRMFGK